MSHRSGDEGQANRRGEVDWARRRFLRRLATVSWMTPAILTVTARRASAQASCASTGQSCAAIPCCSGCTCSVAKVCLGLC